MFDTKAFLIWEMTIGDMEADKFEFVLNVIASKSKLSFF